MLIFELFANGRWNEVGRCLPGQAPGSMSDTQNGVRHIFLFKCIGEQSTIYRLAPGIDVEVEKSRLVPTPLEDSEVVATLRAGESTTITFKTDKAGDAGRIIRFRHV